tara:strand:+ start:143 stop:451 length:309 start_codon:yes stop_codon:yes gene_type:complete
MGKPIKILDIVNSLIKIKQKVDPYYSFIIKTIGLHEGEKINEELTVIKKTKKTKNIDILLTNDPTYNDYQIDKLILDLEKSNNPNLSKKLMTKFLSKEFKKY